MRGQIYRRSSVSWTIQVYLGRDPATGKDRHIKRAVRGSKHDAERELTNLIKKINDGAFVRTDARMTLAEFLIQWLEGQARTKLRRSTWRVYKHNVDNHIIPELGSLRLTSVTPLHIQNFESKMLKEGRVDGRGGLAPRTVHQIHAILSDALGLAARWGMVGSNVVGLVQAPSIRRHEFDTIDSDAIGQFEDALAAEREQYSVALYTAIWTGLRRSEVLGLRWNDVSLPMAHLEVHRGLHRVEGEYITEDPKSSRTRPRGSHPESRPQVRGVQGQ